MWPTQRGRVKEKGETVIDRKKRKVRDGKGLRHRGW